MRGVWLVATSIGGLGVAYAADRWLGEIQMQIGIFGGSEGWRELGLAVALVFRLVLLGALVVIFVTAGRGVSRWASWTIIGIGVIFGVAPPLTLGVHIALAPGGLPFVFLNSETAPLWDGRGVFLLWTAVGLLMIGIASLRARHGNAIRAPLPPLVLVIGAALLFVVSYPVDALFRTLAIELAEAIDAYPAYMLVGLGMRIGVMAAFVVLLSSLLHRRPSRIGVVALLAVGVVGFAVLPVIGLPQANFWDMGDEAAFALDPGTAGRWLAGAALVTGVIQLLRRSSETVKPMGIGQRPAEASVT